MPDIKAARSMAEPQRQAGNTPTQTHSHVNPATEPGHHERAAMTDHGYTAGLLALSGGAGAIVDVVSPKRAVATPAGGGRP